MNLSAIQRTTAILAGVIVGLLLGWITRDLPVAETALVAIAVLSSLGALTYAVGCWWVDR